MRPYSLPRRADERIKPLDTHCHAGGFALFAKAPLLVGLLLLAALSPAAVHAEWYVHGSIEPDTTHDVRGGYMWLDPDTRPAFEGPPRVYFNAIGNFYTSGLNPNSELVGSRFVNFPFQNSGAYLGVWKDCNEDGYIGMAAGALAEYRAELLPGVLICPAGSAFNSGGWVYEFLWIEPGWKPQSSRATPTQRAIVDPEAHVWGDIGLPGEPAMGHRARCEMLRGTGITEVATYPYHGTTSSTGGMLRYADCWTGHNVALLVTLFDPTGELGFEDPENPQRSYNDGRDSLLNQHLPLNVFGNPDAPEGYRTGVYDEKGDQAPAFEAWDCGRPAGTADLRDPTASSGERGDLSSVTVSDPTGRLAGLLPHYFEPDHETTYHFADEDGSYATVPRLAPRANDPAGNYYAAMNHTERGLAVPGDQDGRLVAREHGACEPYEGEGNTSLTYSTRRTIPLEEAPPFDPETSARRYNDYAFYFLKHQTDVFHVARNDTRNAQDTVERQPGGSATGPVWSALRPIADNANPFGSETPTNFGIDAIRFQALVGPAWYAGFRSTTLPLLERSSTNPAAPEYETYYASVGSATLDVAEVRGIGTYGAEWCDGGILQVVNQFDCDPSHWWDVSYDPLSRENRDNDRAGGDLDGDGKHTTDRERRLALDGAEPFWLYHARDIDCKDNSATRHVPLSPAHLSTEGGCEWPARN